MTDAALRQKDFRDNLPYLKQALCRNAEIDGNADFIKSLRYPHIKRMQKLLNVIIRDAEWGKASKWAKGALMPEGETMATLEQSKSSCQDPSFGFSLDLEAIAKTFCKDSDVVAADEEDKAKLAKK